jgi:quinolinate synthase
MIRPALHPLPTVLDYSALSNEELGERIRWRKSELNAVILGHNYQRIEIQDVSDFLGDSLALSQEAAETEADVIVFCGVHFMAETAKILSPEKTVLMPDSRAGCPMADFVTGDALRKQKARYPGAAVVAYVNSSAEVKAESDITCTSANAVEVVESVPVERPIIFVPDRNLAKYVIQETGRENIIAWDGYCYVHDDMVLEELDRAKEAHPNALVVIHPEARPDLLDVADRVTSTSGMVRMAEEHDALIIGTEKGLVDKLQERYPEKTMIPLSGAAICGNMKLNTLAKPGPWITVSTK